MSEAKEESAPKPKKKLLMFIIIGAVALLILVGGGIAAILMLKSSEPAGDEPAAEASHAKADKAAADKKKDDKKHPPVFEKLPQFTVNLNSENGEVMQTDITIELSDAAMGAQIKLLLPKVQGGVNKLLSAKKPEEVKTVEGREKLENEVKELINKIIEAEADHGVLSVNFTTFIVR